MTELDLDSDHESNLSEVTQGDPWQEMENEKKVELDKERGKLQEEKQNEILGINKDDMVFNEENLQVPVKHLVNFAGKGRELKERRQAAFGFAHFSTEKSTQDQITSFKSNYGIRALQSLIQSDDEICRRYASLALANLVGTDNVSKICIHDGVLQLMLHLALEVDDEKVDIETRRYCMLGIANMAKTRIEQSRY